MISRERLPRPAATNQADLENPGSNRRDPGKAEGRRRQQDVPAETPTLPPQIAAWFARRGWTPRAHQFALARSGAGTALDAAHRPDGRRQDACGLSAKSRRARRRSSEKSRGRALHALRLSAQGARSRRCAQPDATDRRDGPQDPDRDAHRRYIGGAPPAPARQRRHISC